MIRLQTVEDYGALLPADLPTEFTAPQFGKLTGLRGRSVYSAIHVLEELGILLPTEKQGRAMVYKLR